MRNWQLCEPLFKMADSKVTYEILQTEKAGHAKHHLQNLDFSDFDGVVSVSGDGLFHEIVNGLMGRTDWEHLKQKISLGIIPGGTSNGLVKSLLDLQGEQYGILEAAWIILRGH